MCVCAGCAQAQGPRWQQPPVPGRAKGIPSSPSLAWAQPPGAGLWNPPANSQAGPEGLQQGQLCWAVTQVTLQDTMAQQGQPGWPGNGSELALLRDPGRAGGTCKRGLTNTEQHQHHRVGQDSTEVLRGHGDNRGKLWHCCLEQPRPNAGWERPNLGKGQEEHQALGSAAALGCRGSCSANKHKGVAISPQSNVHSWFCFSKPPCCANRVFQHPDQTGGICVLTKRKGFKQQ